MKKVGKTTRPLRYNLNHIPYDYTVEVTNRLKGLDSIDRVPEELWTEVCVIIQEAVIKTIPKKKKCKKHRVPYRINRRRNTPIHILIKLTKTKHKERILKGSKGEATSNIQGKPHMLNS